MRVVTWNVLHRIHAVNWDEPTIRAWPDEAARVAAVAAHVAALPADVICLQEVSGDQLAALRAVVDGALLAAPHARVPGYWRRFEPPVLGDPTEHLAVVVRGQGARIVAAAGFAEDAGKGYLAVELDDGARVITAHVTYGAPHAAQCAVLAGLAAGAARVVVCGDFNADAATCGAHLGPGLAIAPLTPGGPPTRPRAAEATKAQDIDHVFAGGAAARAAEVLDGAGRSDHNPVLARLAWA